MTPYLGYVSYFAFNFAPRGWAQCNGQTLAINTNQALFALLSTYYGGNGVSTFCLPDLRGRVVLGQGNQPWGTYVMGQKIGAEAVSVLSQNLPQHTHNITMKVGVNNTPGDSNFPDVLTATGNSGFMFAPASAPSFHYGALNVNLAATGGSTPLPVLNPYTALNACIATQGIFPSRN